jgi:hypothetical protein
MVYGPGVPTIAALRMDRIHPLRNEKKMQHLVASKRITFCMEIAGYSDCLIMSKRDLLLKKQPQHDITPNIDQ